MTPSTRRRTAIRLAVIVAVVVPSVFGFVHYQRTSDLGIFLFRGSHYWFKLARSAEGADEAKAHLQRIIDATQYGVNIAQNHVNSLDETQERLRMFNLLVEIAPNEHWRKLYLLDVQRQRSLLGPTQEGKPDGA